MVCNPREKSGKDVKMVAALADDNRGPAFAYACRYVCRYHSIPLFVASELCDDFGELRRPLLVERLGFRDKRRRTHSYDMPKRRERIHLLCVDAIAHGAAFHLYDRMLPILANNGRRKPEEVSRR